MMDGTNQTMKQFYIKTQKFNKSLLTDDDRRLMVSRNSSNKWKHDFPHHQQKLNVSLNIVMKKIPKNLIIFWLITNKNRGMILNPVQLFLNFF